MADEVKPGKCVVCGEETFLRCQPCSENGVEWMNFCSTEHQRLIFHAHSRVCGPRSNPFYFPSFKVEELDFIPERNWLEPARRPDGKVDLSACSGVVIAGPGSGSSAPGSIGVCQLENDDLSNEDRALAHSARSIRWKVLVQGSNMFDGNKLRKDHDLQGLVHRNPFDLLACSEETLLPGSMNTNVHEVWPWFTTLQHKLLIAVSITQHPLNNESNSVIDTYSDLAIQEVKDFVRDVVSKTEPRLAKNFLPKLLRGLLLTPLDEGMDADEQEMEKPVGEV